MVVTHNFQYQGNKQKVGSPIFTSTGRLNIFIGYCPECKGKCSVSPEEARHLMRMFGHERNKPMQRLLLKLVRRYEYK